MGIGDRIKQRRIELGMSQQELATAMGYTSKSTINKIELGKNDVSQSKVVKFSKVLNTTPSYLMAWDLDDENNDVPDYSKENNEYIEIGQRIKKCRLNLNKSQLDLASSLGIERSTLQKYEAGKRAIPITVLKELSIIFSVSIDYLVTGLNYNGNVKTTSYPINEELSYMIKNTLNTEATIKLIEFARFLSQDKKNLK